MKRFWLSHGLPDVFVAIQTFAIWYAFASGMAA
jgi:hypothetical protein